MSCLTPLLAQEFHKQNLREAASALTLHAGPLMFRGMSIVAFDTLKFVHRLRDAGFPEPQAEAVAEAFKDAQSETEVATKRDLGETESRLHTDLAKTESQLRADMAEMESRLRVDIERVEHRLETKIAEVGSDVRLLEQRMTIKLGGMLLALAGILLAAIRYFPQHP